MEYGKNTIVIIGNGFDIWQGMNTSYASFQKYYAEHLEEILKRLHIKKIRFKDEEGNDGFISDVELIYGNPFDLCDLPDEFWGNFESNLADIDAERVNWFFGKRNADLRWLQKSTRNAVRILRAAFYSWVQDITVPQSEPAYSFPDN